MENNLRIKKEFLLRRNKGKDLIELYIKDLKNILSGTVSKDELIPLEETDSFKDVHFERNFKKSFNLLEINDMNNFIRYFAKCISNEYSYLFTSYTQYCGTIKIKTSVFLDNYQNVLKIKDSIASIISEDTKSEFLIDFDNGKFDLEIKGEPWTSIAESY